MDAEWQLIVLDLILYPTLWWNLVVVFYWLGKLYIEPIEMLHEVGKAILNFVRKRK